MKAEITFNQLWDNPSVRSFFFREQSTKTLQELIDRANEYATDVCEAVENYAEMNGCDLDYIEDMFYEDSVEELAKEFGIELLDDEDE